MEGKLSAPNQGYLQKLLRSLIRNLQAIWTYFLHRTLFKHVAIPSLGQVVDGKEAILYKTKDTLWDLNRYHEKEDVMRGLSIQKTRKERHHKWPSIDTLHNGRHHKWPSINMLHNGRHHMGTSIDMLHNGSHHMGTSIDVIRKGRHHMGTRIDMIKKEGIIRDRASMWYKRKRSYVAEHRYDRKRQASYGAEHRCDTKIRHQLGTRSFMIQKGRYHIGHSNDMIQKGRYHTGTIIYMIQKKYIIWSLSMDITQRGKQLRGLSIDVIKKGQHHIGHGHRRKGNVISCENDSSLSQSLTRNKLRLGKGFRYKYMR